MSVSSGTSTAPVAKAKYTIADYVKDNHFTETPIHHGDPGPNVDLPVPAGWQLNQNATATALRPRSAVSRGGR